jgi:hypothetical protein
MRKFRLDESQVKKDSAAAHSSAYSKPHVETKSGQPKALASTPRKPALKIVGGDSFDEF